MLCELSRWLWPVERTRMVAFLGRSPGSTPGQGSAQLELRWNMWVNAAWLGACAAEMGPLVHFCQPSGDVTAQ